MSIERANQVIKGMVDDDSRGVLGRIGSNTGNIFNKEERIVKVCKECLENGKADYGEVYLHRTHQVPGNFLCIKHKTPLSYFSASNVKRNYDINLDSLWNAELASFQINHNLVKYFTSLGEDVEFVTNGGLSNFSIDTVKQRYRQRLQEKGYLLTGSINQSHLIADFKQFYPNDFLESL